MYILNNFGKNVHTLFFFRKHMECSKKSFQKVKTKLRLL